MTSVVAGIVANPASGRDIRRLTSTASVFPTAEKANMVVRLLGAFGRFGVDRVLMMPDITGISSLVVRALAHRVVVLRHGRVVEEGEADQVFARPREAYTKALMTAAFALHTTKDVVA